MNKIFKQILQQVKQQHLIIESGNALDNCNPIKKEDIQPTLNNVQQKIFNPLNITKDMWTIIGSVGKKDVSGDLDIALDIKQAMKVLNINSEQELINILLKQFSLMNYSTVFLNKFKSINAAIPINNTKQNVQLDIFLTSDLNYMKFKRFSPSAEESKYKGKLRGALLDCLIEELTLRGQDQNNQEIEIKGRKFPSKNYSHISMSDNDDQFIRNYKTLVGKRGNIGSTIYPLKDKREYLGRDYMNILTNILKMDIKQSDLNSFESIWNNIILNKDFPFKNKIQDIKKHCIEYIKRQHGEEYILQELK